MPYARLRGWLVLASICVFLTGLTWGTFVVVQGGGDTLIHLPVIARPRASTGGGTLQNGGTVQGPDGVGIGALTDTLDGPITVVISRTAPPKPASTPGSAGSQPVLRHRDTGKSDGRPGPALRPGLSSWAVMYTQHRALAALSSDETVNDADASLQAWTLLEGQVDAQQGLFLAATAWLESPGRTYALVMHPDVDSPPTQGAASRAGASSPSTPNFNPFNARCMYFVDPTHCTPAIESAEESYASDEMIRSKAGGWLGLHKADRAMNSQANLDAYFAQDFWVFYGQQYGLGLPYLQDVLVEGATTEDVVNTLGNTQLLEDYWVWAKNQVDDAYDYTITFELPIPD